MNLKKVNFNFKKYWVVKDKLVCQIETDYAQ